MDKNEVVVKVYKRIGDIVTETYMHLDLNGSDNPTDYIAKTDDFLAALIGGGYGFKYPDPLVSEEDELYKDITAAIRCVKVKDDGDTDVICFYGNSDYKAIHWYLNNEVDYEYAAKVIGVPVKNMPVAVREAVPSWPIRTNQQHEKQISLSRPLTLIRRQAVDFKTGEKRWFTTTDKTTKKEVKHPIWEFGGFVEVPFEKGGHSGNGTVEDEYTEVVPVQTGWKTKLRLNMNNVQLFDLLLEAIKEEVPTANSDGDLNVALVKNLARELGYTAFSGNLAERGKQFEDIILAYAAAPSGDVPF